MIAGGLAGKVAIVTGGGSGLGAAASRRLAADGAVVAVWDRDGPRAEAVVADIQAVAGKALAVDVDVSDPEAVRTALGRTEDVLGPPGVLFNNAGIRDAIPTLDLSLSDWHKVLGVNLHGAFYCLQEVARSMVAAGRGGSIINTSSITGIRAVPNQVAYVVSKHALIGLTRSAAWDLGRHGIRVNAIAPGHIITPLTQPNLTPELRELISRIPAGRSGQPEEVAEVVLFLAGEGSRYVTGQVIPVDGGWTLAPPLAFA